MCSKTFALRGTLAHATSPSTIEVLRDALVVVTDGVITNIVQGADADALQSTLHDVTQLAEDSILLPGFVDTHVHPAQVTFAGSGTDRPLLGPTGWLECYTYPAERAWADPTVAAEVSGAVVRRALKHGCTTAVYFGTIHFEGTLKLVDACLEQGLRAVVGKVCMDRCSPADYVESTEASLSDMEAFVQATIAKAEVAHPNGPLVHPALTPRFIPTCSTALLAGLGEIARKYNGSDGGDGGSRANKVFVQSHIAQSADQLAFVEKLHPGQRDAALFDAAGLLTDRCVLAHAMHLDESELQLIARRKSALAFCPLSNVFHTEKPASTLDAPNAWRCGCNVGLATDTAGGYAPSMLHACRTAVIASRCLHKDTTVDWKYAFWLATRGGAAALSMPIGGFEVGNEFDAQLVDPSAGDVLLLPGGTRRNSSSTQMKDKPPEEAMALGVLEKYVNLGDDRNVAAVWVRGKQVHLNDASSAAAAFIRLRGGHGGGAVAAKEDDAAGAAESVRLFSAYVRSVWLLQGLMQCYGGSSVGGLFARSNTVLIACVLLTSLTASKRLFAATTLARLCLRLINVPFIWEVEIWAVLMDLTLLCSGCDVVRAAAAIRAQLITFYAGAAFWKINTSCAVHHAFLDATTSCGTIFFAQLLAAYAPSSVVTSPAVASLLRLAAPLAALAVELLVPILLLCWRKLGLALALLFHLLVVLTPPPNNAGGFSVCAAQYLFFFAPDATAAVLSEVAKGDTTARALALATGIAFSLGRRVGTHPFFFDTAPCAYFVQLVILARTVYKMPMFTATTPTTTAPPPAASVSATRVTLPLVAAVLYAFVLPSLGVLDQMAPNMFSNQRYHAGSNHLLVPTGLLHASLGVGAFSVIRVHKTSSLLIGRQYPAEVTASFDPAARQLLKSVGHSARMWNPMLGRVIGLMAVAGPVPEDAASKPDARYTLPAIELRRLIGEAKAAGESFALEYARLDTLEPPNGAASAEAWRAKSKGTHVTYTYDAASGSAKCHVGKGLLAGLLSPCAPDEVALLPPPPWWATKLAAFQPLPILTGEGWGEVHCYGP